MVLTNICLKKETALWRHSSNNIENSHHFTECVLNARPCTGHFLCDSHLLSYTNSERDVLLFSHFQRKKVKLKHIELTKGDPARKW